MLVRKCKDSLGINMTMKIFFIFVPVQTMKKKIMLVPVQQYKQASCEKHSTEWRLPAATVTTDAEPHAQRQLARDLEVDSAVMGQRCRPQSFGEVQRCNTLYFL